MNNFYCTTCRCTRAFHNQIDGFQCPVCGKTLQKKDPARIAGERGR